eukprot:s1554_g11.t1
MKNHVNMNCDQSESENVGSNGWAARGLTLPLTWLRERERECERECKQKCERECDRKCERECQRDCERDCEVGVPSLEPNLSHMQWMRTPSQGIRTFNKDCRVPTAFLEATNHDVRTKQIRLPMHKGSTSLKRKSTPSFVESLGINGKSCRPVREILVPVIQHSDREIPRNRCHHRDRATPVQTCSQVFTISSPTECE